MKLPEHANPTGPRHHILDRDTGDFIDVHSVAPYNFVRLPKAIQTIKNPPTQGIYDAKLLIGKLTCTLINWTPIYVRAAQTMDEFLANPPQIPSSPFYGASKEKYIIPGSSIRGMLRTLVEIVSYSRIYPVTNKQLFYRSMEDTSMGITYRDRMKDKVRAGFYHKNKSKSWIEPTVAGRVTRDAIRDKFGVRDIYKEFEENDQRIRASSPKRVPKDELQYQTVYVKLNENTRDDVKHFRLVEDFEREETGDLEEAILVITGDMKSRDSEKKEFVFIKSGSSETIDLTDEQVELFEDKDQITPYQEFAFPNPNDRTQDGKLKDGDPVFYLFDEDEQQLIGFGRAYMFRLPYKRSPLELLPLSLNGNPSEYDMAESMFGYVPPSKQKNGRKEVASRLFITDAVFQGDPVKALFSDKPINLKVLSSPKPTTFQHYLTQKEPDDQNKLRHYDSLSTGTTLRGHKFYWQKSDVQRGDFEANQSEVRMHPTQYAPPVKPLREKQEFRFTIYFENLRFEELGALLWILDKAGKDSRYRLKLGMGKPYGLGSISIDFEPFLEDRKQRYEKLFSDSTKTNDAGTWYTVENTEISLDSARNEFAQWLLKSPNATFEQVNEIKRIQELLIMLSWEGHPSTDQTRYMEIEHSEMHNGQNVKYNEYRTRSVLPTPNVVFGRWLHEPPTDIPDPEPIPPQPNSKKEKIRRVKPEPVLKESSEYVIGDIIQTTVVDAPAGKDVYLAPETLTPNAEDICIIRAKNRGLKRFVEGQTITVQISSIKGDDKTGYRFECELVD